MTFPAEMKRKARKEGEAIIRVEVDGSFLPKELAAEAGKFELLFAAKPGDPALDEVLSLVKRWVDREREKEWRSVQEPTYAVTLVDGTKVGVRYCNVDPDFPWGQHTNGVPDVWVKVKGDRAWVRVGRGTDHALFTPTFRPLLLAQPTILDLRAKLIEILPNYVDALFARAGIVEESTWKILDDGRDKTCPPQWRW